MRIASGLKSIFEMPDHLHLRWKHPTANVVSYSPSIADGVKYVGSADGL